MSTAIKVGIFLVAGIVLFCIGLFLIGNQAQLFGSHFVVYTQFNNIDTLQTGATVRVSGMNAGQIAGITVPSGPTKEFRLKLSVDKKFRPIVRGDSLASIETEGMVGNKFVNIQKGSESSPECPPGCTLPSQESVSMGELMRQGSQIASSLGTTVSKVNTLMKELSPKIEQVASNSVGMTGNLNAITAGMRQGRGAAGKLLIDPTVASNVDKTVSNAEQASSDLKHASSSVNSMISDVRSKDLTVLHQSLQNTQAMTGQMNHAVTTFLAKGNHSQDTATALRDTVHSAQRASTNLAADTEALKHNFFFRGFFNRRGFYDFSTITPSKYEASRFVKKPKARVWIPAAGLFQTGTDGSQELTKVGQSILDQSMSDLVPYLPNNPVVVEGYSNTGMPDQQYLTSRQRALAVRDYLDSHFHLKPNRVGIMPFADHPPAGVHKKTWDGVCLVLVVSKLQDGLF